MTPIGALAVIGSVSSTQLHRDNFETLELLNEKMKSWVVQLGEDETVDRLVEIGRRLLRESEAFQELLVELGAGLPASPAH
jgi:hypothetical protein